MNLSNHFTLAEMTHTAHKGVNNDPDALQRESLMLLCVNVLEPLRERLGMPIFIGSGFRSAELNRKVGGSPRSQHMRGEAADIVVQGMKVAEVVKLIREMNLPVDQCIDEFGAWIHISHRRGTWQRGQYLLARKVGGKTVYLEA